LKRDQEIDEVVLAVRKRDKKDFGNLAAKFKQEDKNAEQFALAVSKSDDFKPFEVIGEGDQNPTEDAQGQIRVIGLRGIAQGSVGERFIQTDAFKSLRDRVKAKGRGALERNTSVSQEINDVVMGNFLNSAATPTSTGLTSIDKQAPVRGLGLRQLMVKDLLAGGTTNATTIRYIREVSFANEADVVAEAAAKPEALFEFAEVDAPVRKIAAYVKMPDELIADYAAVASFINMRLPYKVERKEEDELLNGSGSGQHLTGLLNTAASRRRPKAPTLARTRSSRRSPTFAFGSGLAEGGWEADGIVVNPLDWENLRLAKDGNNQYFGGGPFTGAYGNGAMVTFESHLGQARGDHPGDCGRHGAGRCVPHRGAVLPAPGHDD
jgi:hypothetical protein